jgi:methylglyoxal/glyoxal reductase
VQFCKEHGIVVEAYSPLTRGEKLGHPALVEIARRHGRTPAQVALRWALQHDLVVLPKSARPQRIYENLAARELTLTSEDMARLDALDEGFRTCWDPTDLP